MLFQLSALGISSINLHSLSPGVIEQRRGEEILDDQSVTLDERHDEAKIELNRVFFFFFIPSFRKRTLESSVGMPTMKLNVPRMTRLRSILDVLRIMTIIMTI